MRNVRSSANAPARASSADRLAASRVSSPAATASRFSRFTFSICVVALHSEPVLALMGFELELAVWVALLPVEDVPSVLRAVAIKSSRGSNQSGSMPSTEGMGLSRPTELAFEEARCRKSGDNWKPLRFVW